MTKVKEFLQKTAKYPHLADNIVPIIFILFTLLGFLVASGVPLNYFFTDLSSRFYRNAFLVLSLLIPVIAGLGLNFGIVLGAISGQIAIVIVRYFGIQGFWGLLLCFVIAVPIAVICGYLTGRLYNKTRGQEMIASLIVGWFANGVYQFLFLFAVGVIIPVAANHPMIKLDGVGIRMTVDMGTLNYALESPLQIPFIWAVLGVAGALLAFTMYKQFSRKHLLVKKCSKPVFTVLFIILTILTAVWLAAIILGQLLALPISMPVIWGLLLIFGHSLAFLVFRQVVKNEIVLKKAPLQKFIVNIIVLLGLGAACGVSILTNSNLMYVKKVPVLIVMLIAWLCIFTAMIMKTKLGQDFRSVGQNQHIAQANGINVDKTRIIAVVISTVLAAWGQIIYLQNMGTLNVYGAHTQIGMFSVAALLVGGASVRKASIRHALVGTILFNSMFIMSPEIGKAVFGDALLGEYFRTFMVYGVIGMALGIYVWNENRKSRISLDPELMKKVSG